MSRAVFLYIFLFLFFACFLTISVVFLPGKPRLSRYPNNNQRVGNPTATAHVKPQQLPGNTVPSTAGAGVQLNINDSEHKHTGLLVSARYFTMVNYARKWQQKHTEFFSSYGLMKRLMEAQSQAQSEACGYLCSLCSITFKFLVVQFFPRLHEGLLSVHVHVWLLFGILI